MNSVVKVNSFSKKGVEFYLQVLVEKTLYRLSRRFLVSRSRSCILIHSSLYHLLALAGMEKPLVMKSLCLLLASSFDEENRLLRLSFVPSRRFFCRSSCSLRTLAVSAAVASFLMFPELSLTP